MHIFSIFETLPWWDSPAGYALQGSPPSDKKGLCIDGILLQATLCRDLHLAEKAR